VADPYTPSFVHNVAMIPTVFTNYSTNYGEARDPSTCKPPACIPTLFHPGVDLTAPPSYTATQGSSEGLPIYAPFDGWILYSGSLAQADADVRGWLDGYGPGAVLLAHDDLPTSAAQSIINALSWPLNKPNPQSAYYTLIAHLDPVFSIPLDGDVRKLQRARGNAGVGTGGRWWQVKDAGDVKLDASKWTPNQMLDGTSHDVMMYQPGAGRQLAASGIDGARYVTKGTLLGHMRGDMAHVHWETRATPFASPGPREAGNTSTALAFQQQRVDPWGWLGHYVDIGTLPPPDRTPIAATSKKGSRTSSGGGAGWLLLAGLLLLASEDKRGRRSRR
jgi:hypothetical protein